MLEDLYAQLRIVAIDEPLARHAGDLAAQRALRGYDAVHLACALHLQGDDILVATWDTALSAAASATGRLMPPTPAEPGVGGPRDPFVAIHDRRRGRQESRQKSNWAAQTLRIRVRKHLTFDL